MMLYVYALKIIRRVMAERSSAEENRLKKLKSKAKSLVDEIDKYWIFVYEILSKEELPIGEYLTLKKRGISFIKTEFQ